MSNPLDRYVEMATGVRTATKKQAQEIIRNLQDRDLLKELVAQGEVASDRVEQLVDDLVERGKENREQLIELIRKESKDAVNRLGLARSTEVREVARRLDRIERQLGTAPAKRTTKKSGKKTGKKTGKKSAKKSAKKGAKKSAKKSAKKGAKKSAKKGAKKAAKRTGAKKTAKKGAKKAAKRTGAKKTAKKGAKKAAKRTGAKKTAKKGAKKTPAKKSAAKRTPAKKAAPKRTPAKKTAARPTKTAPPKSAAPRP